MSAPPRLKRPRFFYGWVILLAGTIGQIMTGPGQTYTVSIFVEHFISDLEISRSLVSGLYTLGTLAGSLALPFWGRLIDGSGTRTVVVIVSILFGLACVYMGFVANALMLGLGFVAIRMLGQGSLSLASQTVMNHWWVRRRGMILGISGTVVAVLGMGAFPNLVYGLVSNFGWRTAYPLMGAALILVMAPLGYWLFRKQPEVYGLKPDGDHADGVSQPRVGQASEAGEDWTLRRAIATPAFWVVVVGLALFNLLSTGLIFHMARIIEDSGLDSAVAAQVYVPIALASAISNLAAGAVSDRLPVRVLLSTALLAMAATLLMVTRLDSSVSAYVFGAVLGLTGGIFHMLAVVVWPTFYGRKHLGSIAGFAMFTGVVGAALGPLPFGLARDLVGSYQPVVWVSAIVAVGLSLLSFFLAKPTNATRDLGAMRIS